MGGAVLWLAVGSAAFAAGPQITQTMDGASIYAAGHQIRNEQVIPVDTSPVVLATWEQRDANGAFRPMAGVSMDGQTFARVTEASYELGLAYARFDPLVNIPAVPAELSAGADVNLYIVQFWTQPVPAFRTGIEARGGTIRHVVPQWSFLVEMSPEERAEVAALPYVRWVGAWQPAYRLEPFLIEHLADAASAYPSQHYNIRVLAVSQKADIAAKIAAIGGRVEMADAGKYLVEATLTPGQLFQTARWDEVLFIDRWSPLEPDMDIARQLGGANYLETVTGFAGQGVRGEVFDTGFNLVHECWTGHTPMTHGSVGSDSHGSSTSGIVFGNGTGRPQARGLLPLGDPLLGDYNVIGMTGMSRYTSTSQLVQAPYYAVFQTSSVGSSQTSAYTTISADTDDMLFDFDILFCQSQSNLGTTSSRPQAWAKNIVSGGAAYHYNTLSTADDRWNHGASIGPASDGRIKPTLCAFYDAIYTTDCCAPTSYTSGFGGTSGATPIIAGHFGLLFQMWDAGLFGNPVDPSGTVFENKPHATTARALMINTAEQYDFSGASHDLTRTHQGWGRPSVKQLYDLRQKMFIVDETDPLLQFENKEYYVDVAAGEPAFKVTMIYLDPAGNPGTPSQHRINDLTLEVFSPSGVRYCGNYGLLTAMWSPPAPTIGGLDHKNTEENVFVQNPEAGIWRIRVKAEEIVQDARVESPQMDADFALVASGATGVATGVHDQSLAPQALAFRCRGIRPGAPNAELTFSLPAPSGVRLVLHDVQGRRVATLFEGAMGAGAQSVTWDGRDAQGSTVAPGVYYARLEVGKAESTGKVVVVR